MKALLRIALLIFKYSVLLLLCWLARCLYTLPTLENAFLQIGQGYLGEKFLAQCTVQLSYPSHVPSEPAHIVVVLLVHVLLAAV